MSEIYVRHPSGKTTIINKCLDVETLFDEVCLKCDIERYNVKLVNSNRVHITLPEHITETIYLVILSPFVFTLNDKSKIIHYTKGILDFKARKITVYQWGNYNYEGHFNLYDLYQEIVLLAKDSPCLISVNSLEDCFCCIKIKGAEGLVLWDVSSVTNMSNMFNNSEFYGDAVLDISHWNVSNVTNMSSMFDNSEFNVDIDISNWNVSNVTDMSRMFYQSTFNGDISKWDVSNVTNMNNMFNYSNFYGDISKWDVSNVTDMKQMFFSSSLMVTRRQPD